MQHTSKLKAILKKCDKDQQLIYSKKAFLMFFSFFLFSQKIQSVKCTEVWLTDMRM